MVWWLLIILIILIEPVMFLAFLIKEKIFNQLSLFKESQDLLFDHLFFKMNFRKIYAGVISKELCLVSEKLWGLKKRNL